MEQESEMKICKNCKYIRNAVSPEGKTTCVACIAYTNEDNGKVLLMTHDEGVCSKCGMESSIFYGNYCPICGQRITIEPVPLNTGLGM